MTVDEFVRNNRGINGGEDLPREFLRALYTSIAADEIRISSEAQAGPICLRWSRNLDRLNTLSLLQRQGCTPRAMLLLLTLLRFA